MRNIISNTITLIAGTLLLMPCLLVLNENENIAINIIGLLYCLVLSLAIKYAKELKSLRIKLKQLLKRLGDD